MFMVKSAARSVVTLIDGSDIFRFAATFGVYVTERLKEHLDKIEANGVLFRPATIPLEEWKKSNL